MHVVTDTQELLSRYNKLNIIRKHKQKQISGHQSITKVTYNLTCTHEFDYKETVKLNITRTMLKCHQILDYQQAVNNVYNSF